MSDALMNRIAALETELSSLRSQNTPMALKQRLISNPIGFYQSLGLTPDETNHLRRVNFADALGEQATPEMRMYAQLGPAMAQQSQLATTIESLSRRLDELVEKPRREESTRESIKALIAKKEEYPFLSAAVAANPSLLDAEVKGRTGDAADIAKELEAKAATFANAYGFKPAQPASADADKKEAQSMESKPASLAGVVMDVPPLPQPSAGPITVDEDAKLKEEIIRKYGL